MKGKKDEDNLLYLSRELSHPFDGIRFNERNTPQRPELRSVSNTSVSRFLYLYGISTIELHTNRDCRNKKPTVAISGRASGTIKKTSITTGRTIREAIPPIPLNSVVSQLKIPFLLSLVSELLHLLSNSSGSFPYLV